MMQCLIASSPFCAARSDVGKKLSSLLRLLFMFCICLSGETQAQAMLYADHPLAGKIWDMQRGVMIDETALLARVAEADVLLLGETHDNPEHHALQLKVLRFRLDAGARPALLFEQFDREVQAALDAALVKKPLDAAIDAAGTLMKGWDWSFYRPLLAAGLERGVPAIAGNLSRAAARPVVREGYAVLGTGERERLALETVWDDARQRYLAGLIEASHCGQVDTKMRDGLVLGQRLRDATLADAALPHAPRGVVGIVGRGHARRDTGLPLYLAARSPETKVYTIAFVEVRPGETDPASYERDRATAAVPFDAIWFTPQAERADPCAHFKARSSSTDASRS